MRSPVGQKEPNKDKGEGSSRVKCKKQRWSGKWRADAGARDGHVSTPEAGGLDAGADRAVVGPVRLGQRGCRDQECPARMNAGDDGLNQDLNMILHDLTPGLCSGSETAGSWPWRADAGADRAVVRTVRLRRRGCGGRECPGACECRR